MVGGNAAVTELDLFEQISSGYYRSLRYICRSASWSLNAFVQRQS
jgi:hypothetical protein